MPLRALLLLAFPLLLSGCITHTVTTRFYDNGAIRVFFRHQERSGDEIPRGYDHPATVSPERLAHVLALVDVETREDKTEVRRPAVASELLLPVAELLSGALAEASPNQEIAVVAVRKERRLGIFHRKYLTSFVAYMKDDSLFIHLSRVEWEVPKNDEDDLPEPHIGDRVMPFRALPARAMSSVGTQELAVRWRDPVFGEPLARRGDEVRRRTVLMDSPIPQDERTAPLPEGLSPETLRDLADLEEARQRGDITEHDYWTQREKLLQGAGPQE